MLKKLLPSVVLMFSVTATTLKAQEFSANAKAEIAKNNFKPAIEELTGFLQTHPDNEALLTYRANFYTRTGENEKAISDATRLMTINPKSTDGLITMGMAKMGLGKTNEAVDYLTQALTLKPTFRQALIQRAKAYFNLEQPEKALTDLNTVIQQDPKNLEAYVYRGQLYTALEKFDAAKADYDVILKNAIAGDKYHAAATQKIAAMKETEAQVKNAKLKKTEEDAYAKKLSDQASAMSKEVGETTIRISKMLQLYTQEMQELTKRSTDVPKSNWQEKTKLYGEIHSRATKYIADITKEQSKLKGNTLFSESISLLDNVKTSLETILERSSPYAARRQQYVAETDAISAEMTANFHKMKDAQKSSNEAEFERNKILAIGRAKAQLTNLKQVQGELKKIDAKKFQAEDQGKLAANIEDYEKALGTLNGFKY